MHDLPILSFHCPQFPLHQASPKLYAGKAKLPSKEFADMHQDYLNNQFFFVCPYLSFRFFRKGIFVMIVIFIMIMMIFLFCSPV